MFIVQGYLIICHYFTYNKNFGYQFKNVQGDLVFQIPPRGKRAKLFTTIVSANGRGILWHARRFISKSEKDNNSSRLGSLISTICSSATQNAVIYSRVLIGVWKNVCYFHFAIER